MDLGLVAMIGLGAALRSASGGPQLRGMGVRSLVTAGPVDPFFFVVVWVSRAKPG
ncbi:hypothetical protein [Catenuloplanes atrovinosus]|nr:hypothetical protein [Catenuloplanes atrovinosus]